MQRYVSVAGDKQDALCLARRRLANALGRYMWAFEGRASTAQPDFGRAPSIGA